MLLLLLSLGCDRSTCDSKALTKLAEARCEAWMACPEFAPRLTSMYADLDACVVAMIADEKEFCRWATEAPCNGEIVLSKVNDCIALYDGSVKTCEQEPDCDYIDTGYEDNGIYRGVDWDCTPIYE